MFKRNKQTVKASHPSSSPLIARAEIVNSPQKAASPNILSDEEIKNNLKNSLKRSPGTRVVSPESQHRRWKFPAILGDNNSNKGSSSSSQVKQQQQQQIPARLLVAPDFLCADDHQRSTSDAEPFAALPITMDFMPEAQTTSAPSRAIVEIVLPGLDSEVEDIEDDAEISSEVGSGDAEQEEDAFADNAVHVRSLVPREVLMNSEFSQESSLGEEMENSFANYYCRVAMEALDEDRVLENALGEQVDETEREPRILESPSRLTSTQTTEYDSFPAEQQEQEFPPESMVEIFPGCLLPLRGSAETWAAYEDGRVREVQCTDCQACLYCVLKATMVICPCCRGISPVFAEGCDEEKPSIGLGLSVNAVPQQLRTVGIF